MKALVLEKRTYTKDAAITWKHKKLFNNNHYITNCIYDIVRSSSIFNARNCYVFATLRITLLSQYYYNINLSQKLNCPNCSLNGIIDFLYRKNKTKTYDIHVIQCDLELNFNYVFLSWQLFLIESI